MSFYCASFFNTVNLKLLLIFSKRNAFFSVQFVNLNLFPVLPSVCSMAGRKKWIPKRIKQMKVLIKFPIFLKKLSRIIFLTHFGDFKDLCEKSIYRMAMFNLHLEWLKWLCDNCIHFWNFYTIKFLFLLNFSIFC